MPLYYKSRLKQILTQRHVPITEHMLMPELHSQLAGIGASTLLHCIENLDQYYSALKAQNSQDATYGKIVIVI